VARGCIDGEADAGDRDGGRELRSGIFEVDAKWGRALGIRMAEAWNVLAQERNRKMVAEGFDCI
jgi:hypothetical protein